MASELKEQYTVQKNLGETPLEALERVRISENIPDDVPMTYAGRLDPAAEGLLIILTGDECKKKEEYTKLGKTYEAEIIFGVSTDTYDLLGMPTEGEGIQLSELRVHAEEYLAAHLGAQTQAYPLYSSKTVDGVQLHQHAKEGSDIEMPTHEVSLHSYLNLEVGKRTDSETIERVQLIAGLVKGDFRQKEIMDAWEEIILPRVLPSLKIKLHVGSGFYIRQLAEDMGQALGTGACLYSLVRTKIDIG